MKRIFSERERKILDRWEKSKIPQLRIRASEMKAIETMALSGYFDKMSECIKNNDCAKCEHIRNGIWCSFYCMKFECAIGSWELTEEQKKIIRETKPTVPVCRELSVCFHKGCLSYEPEQCLKEGKISNLKQCPKARA